MKSQMLLLQSDPKCIGSIQSDNQASRRRTICSVAGVKPIIWRGGKQYIVEGFNKLREIEQLK